MTLLSKDFLKWLCDNARHGGEDDIPEENEPEDEEGRSGSASSGETEVVMSTISIVVDDAQPRPPATQSPYPRVSHVRAAFKTLRSAVCFEMGTGYYFTPGLMIYEWSVDYFRRYPVLAFLAPWKSISEQEYDRI